MDKIIGKVSTVEKEEIEKLFEKKVALENLTKVIEPESNPKLYEKLIEDYGKIMISFNSWWSNIGKKYELNNENIYINFDTCELYER